MNIGFVSLGCSKNRVDTEIMMGLLKKAGHTIVESHNKAEAIIINTCGFITEAQEEAIDAILEAGRLKNKGIIKYIIAAGCLVQRYERQLLDEMPELDALVGVASFTQIAQVIADLEKGDRVIKLGMPSASFMEDGPRILSTPPGFAYLKIVEGCDNHCSYCVIPSLRGRLRSKPREAIMQEAMQLVKKGVKEIILIGQDTTVYGRDLTGQNELTGVLHDLIRIDGLEWIRMMYLHPAHIDNELIETVAELRILPYLDIPIQHVNNDILRRMNRGYDRQYLQELVARLRAGIDGLVLRTTIMVGFPGEKDDDFKELYDFVGINEFDWLGVFAFQAQENTPAAAMTNQVPPEIAQQRRDELMRLQRKITRRKNQDRLHVQYKILVSSQTDKNLYIGRGYFQAPEVDGITIIKSQSRLKKGDFALATLKAIRDYDMIGEILDEPTQ